MEDIKTRLALYRGRCARLMVLQIDISHLKYRIDKLQSDPPRAPYEPKAVPVASVQSYSDLPRTQVLYGTLEGREGYDPALELRAALKKAEETAEELQLEKSKMEAALCCLDAKERLVVMQTYMDNIAWQDLASGMESAYGFYPSQTWIVRMRKEALNKLEKCLATELTEIDCQKTAS